MEILGFKSQGLSDKKAQSVSKLLKWVWGSCILVQSCEACKQLLSFLQEEADTKKTSDLCTSQTQKSTAKYQRNIERIHA